MESRGKAVRCDVLDLPELTRVIRDNDVESIVHAAMFSDYEGTIYQCLQTNVVGIMNVMEAAAIGSVKRVTYISSDDVPFGETESILIVSPLGALTPSKKCGVVISLFYGEAFGIVVTIMKGTGSFWGPYSQHEHRNQITLRSIMEGVTKGKPVNLPHIGKDEKLRLCYGGDAAAGIALVHLASKPQHRVYVVPGGKLATWGEIEKIIKEFVPGSTITFGKSDMPTSEEVVLELEKLAITTEFGFKPKYGLRKGLQEYIKWYQNGQL